MIRYFKEIFSGAWSLLVGMKITAHYGLQKPITVHYPFEKIEITPNFRGHTDLVVDRENGYHLCITCGMCERTCPSNCITLDTVKPEGAKKKVLVAYHLDFTKCSLCGNCVEVCPTSALAYSHEYNLVGTSRHDFHFDLLERCKRSAASMGIEWRPPEIKEKAEAKPEPAPAAS
jgi:NADH-quinone oxidoreductase chain I